MQTTNQRTNRPTYPPSSTVINFTVTLYHTDRLSYRPTAIWNKFELKNSARVAVELLKLTCNSSRRWLNGCDGGWQMITALLDTWKRITLAFQIFCLTPPIHIKNFHLIFRSLFFFLLLVCTVISTLILRFFLNFFL